MLYRKIEQPIRDYLVNHSDRVLVVQGARQIGKSYIINHVIRSIFENVMELNLVEDKAGPQLFAGVRSVEDFYLRLSTVHGDKMAGDRSNTVVFLDEIQEYPHLLTMLKFLNNDGRFTLVASGSLLGVTLNVTTSIPVGSLRIMDMYPLDFEEFIRANGVGDYAIDVMRGKYEAGESLDEGLHNRMLDLWRKYLVVGGMPAAVNAFLATKNLMEVRDVQSDIARLYAADASKYDVEHRMKIRRIYDLIPSYMESRRKRVVAKDIEGKAGSRFAQYDDEFEYLVSSGIALEVQSVSNPKYPLAESVTKNLIKLYMNDCGLLTAQLYDSDVNAVLDDVASINLGSVYETAVASQLKALGHDLYYYDNKKKGEVDFLINDRKLRGVIPLEVKSGKDYTVHSAIDSFVGTPDYGVKRAVVLSNARETEQAGVISHLPVYYVMFMGRG